MQGLSLVSEGNSDIAVGISGFGSAKIPISRWQVLADMTGRTTYTLTYDAQELPWPVPTSLTLLEMMRRWKKARGAAEEVSGFLAEWIRRWTGAGRNVLIVGFSLGGFVAWKAVSQAASENIEVILISAALGDRPDQWAASGQIGALVNLYSSQDLALRRIYPVAVKAHERPAAGLGPLSSPRGSPVYNVDVTDLVGWDHLWASSNVGHLAGLGLSMLKGIQPLKELPPISLEREPGVVLLDGVELQRLYRWMNADPELWSMLGRAMEGDSEAARTCSLLDDWSQEDGRLSDLFALGRSARALQDRPCCHREAARSLTELSGLLRRFLEVTSFTTGAGMYDLPTREIPSPR